MNGYGSGTSGTGGGWYADPTGRHQHRFWNGAAWTDDVSDSGVPGKDPLVAQTPQWGAVQAPGVVPANPYAATDPYGGGTTFSAAAPYGAYPAAAVAAGGRSAGRIAGAIVGVVGGALVVGGTFLDWLSFGSFSFTGWDIYDAQSKVSENVLVVERMFTGWSPFFTGLTTLICGVVLIVLALLVLALPGSKTPGGREINAGVGVLFSLIAFLAALPGLWNVFEWVLNGRDKEFGTGITTGVGLWLVFAGAIAALLGITTALGRHRPRA